ncbi:prepilin-type N-terminal cleavage/methylation domain-containing protein [Roseivivax marinus]|uniref:prepilin-type N-terminal cleavage/methylation domain-containing protein n=1 Tax=Roseivivax marinus TaxID=1379903 RepID=UPI00273F26A3|nr:prepilin-type N-terminal cleavage/methylation domain-containing protein [Roseivivax marinus]
MDRKLNPARSGPPRGFTLIELLVVAAILATLATAAGLAVARPPAAEADAARFLRVAEGVRRDAVAGQVWRGLDAGGGALRLWRLGADGTWQTVGAPLSLRGRVALRQVDVRMPTGAPDIVLAPTGEVSGFEVLFSGGRDAAVRCMAGGPTPVICR